MNRQHTLALLAWILVSAAYLIVELRHNTIVWDWKGFDLTTLMAAGLYALGLLGFFEASRASRRPVLVFALALALCVWGLAGLGEYRGSDVKPRSPAPQTYRIVCAGLMALPALFTGASLLRPRRRRDDLDEPTDDRLQ